MRRPTAVPPSRVHPRLLLMSGRTATIGGTDGARTPTEHAARAAQRGGRGGSSLPRTCTTCGGCAVLKRPVSQPLSTTRIYAAARSLRGSQRGAPRRESRASASNTARRLGRHRPSTRAVCGRLWLHGHGAARRHVVTWSRQRADALQSGGVCCRAGRWDGRDGAMRDSSLYSAATASSSLSTPGSRSHGTKSYCNSPLCCRMR